MEVISTFENIIINNSEKNESLWCNKMDGRLYPTSGDELSETWNPKCKGIVHGVIGKMQLLPGSTWHLLLISGSEFVGYLPNAVEVYVITSIVALPLTSEAPGNLEGELEACPKHQKVTMNETVGDKSVAQQKVQQTWNNFKSSANSLTGKSNIFVKDLKEKDKLEKRLLEELLKMFNDTRSFYYSPNGDITNSCQREAKLKAEGYEGRRTDDRFFWNKFMLQELLESKDDRAIGWVLPVMQGFVEIERCSVDHLEDLNSSVDGMEDDEEDWDIVDRGMVPKCTTAENLKEDEYDLIVISRRSRHRAGTRYRRRGVDEDGHVANYVETEQITCVLNHIVSHVQLRGSIPVYWSQLGTKYRPLPQIDKSFSDSAEAFAKHFNEDFQSFKKEYVVSLVELGGREKTMADAFMDHIINLNSENLLFVVFDFHEHCRGMKFENVSILIQALEEYIYSMGLLWLDNNGVISEQQNVFRINCMDCLDRTNVVQANIAREVLLLTLRKLGRLLPDEELPSTCRKIHNFMWANNGDAISRQYAGTAAMKGDFTRTGERRFAGLMKDGYNSANRYYLNRFRDNYRQTVIDMMLGNSIADDLSVIASENKPNVDDVTWTSDKEEYIKQLVRHAELTLVPPDEECLGGWALIDPYSFVLPTENPQDEDVILMLTRQAYYVARYNEVSEELHSYQRIPIGDLEKIEISVETVKGPNVFMRLYYRHQSVSGYFHTMKAIQSRSTDEAKGILLSIAEVFHTYYQDFQGQTLRVTETRFDKKRSKEHTNIRPLSSKRTLSTSSRTKLTLERKSSNTNAAKNSSSPSKEGNARMLREIPTIQCGSDDNGDFQKAHARYSPLPPSSPSKELALKKSASDNSLNKLEPAAQSTKENKFDLLFRKTKNAFGNVGPRFRDMSATSKDESKRSADTVNETKRTTDATTSMKTRLLRLNEGILSKANEVKNPLKMIPDFRSKIQTVLASPRTRKKTRVLTEEEIARRNNCKTKIIEL